jgi:dTDP-4-amino-4,6-dideoxygalactose transaminase
MDIENIPFARPFIRKEEEEAVLRVLRSGWLTTGKETLAFEAEFSAFFEYDASPAPLLSLAVNSATSGLHLALEACGVGPGDVVLVPSFTFTSTAETARYLGADVAFVDTAPGSFLMDPAALEKTLVRLSGGLFAYKGRRKGVEGFGPSGRPRVVIPVHYGGLPCDMDAIMAISRRYGAKVIEDAAHSFPSRFPDGRFAGTLADAGVFSFYATKTLTTGEGGMMITRDRELAARIALMRSHGIDRTVWNRYTDQKASWYYEVVELGFKYNLPDLLAAVGREQLKRAWDLLEMRRSIAARYDAAFGADRRFTIPPTGPADARHLYPLTLNLEHLALSRDTVIEKLQEGGVGVSVHFIPLHTMPYYKNQYGLRPEDFPESLKCFQGLISLPIWPGMTGAQVESVIALVKSDAVGRTGN